MLTDKQIELAENKTEQFFRYMGFETFPYQQLPSRFSDSINPSKYVVISDPHTPYDNLKVKAEIETKHKDAKTLICTGDVMDCYSKSRFPKTKDVGFNDELRAGFMFLEWCSINFTESFIMSGNHDDRSEKAILRDLKDPTLLILTETNLLGFLASWFPNVHIVGHQVHNDLRIKHIWQYGDVIFTHAEVSSRQESALLNKISQYLHEWKDVLRLKPYRVIMQAHNHVADNLARGTEHWYSLPTASDPYGIGMEYIFSSKIMGKPPQTGYTIMYQTDGVTDCNETRHYLVK